MASSGGGGGGSVGSSNVGLAFDQHGQLVQITQLMGDMSQQAQAAQSNAFANSDVFQVHSTTAGEQQQQQQYFAVANSGGNSGQQHGVALSPLKQQPQVYLSQQQTPMSGGGGDSGDQTNQVHTIILNGQPALFIPASAAMSSSLLCQMMMNGGGGQVIPQNMSGGGSSSGLDLANAATNGAQYEFIQFPAGANDASSQSGNGQSQQQQHQQYINVDQLFNGGGAGAYDLGQQISLSQAVQQQQQQAATLACSDGGVGQQMAFIQLPHKPMCDQQQQQLVCINNGDILSALQSLPTTVQHQDVPHSQAENADSRAKSGSKCAPILPAPEGGRKISMVRTTPKKAKGPTVASVLASSNSLHGFSSSSIYSSPDSHGRMQSAAKTPRSNKVSSILNETRAAIAKQSMDAMHVEQHQHHQIHHHHQQQQPEQSIQLIFLNTTNMTTASNPAAVLVNKPEEPVKAMTPSARTGDRETERAASKSSKEDKKRRKACECPNCVRWRSNLMTEEELKKRRTHKCHKCVKEYNKTSHLRAHLRAHDGYRPFVCEFSSCGKSFTRSDELKRHSRIHNDDRNFACSICNKKFLRSDHLNKHVLVHSKPATGSMTISMLDMSSPPSPLSDSSDASDSLLEQSPGRATATVAGQAQRIPLS